jgi:hypothetical protein
MMHFVFVGFQGDIGSKKGMDSTCMQNIVDEGDIDANGNTQIGIATHSVPAKDTSDDEFYDSQDEHEGCGYDTREFRKGKVRKAGNAELSKQNVQNAVELYPQQESLQIHEALDFTSETEEKMLDVTMSEVDFEEHDLYKLSALTEDSPNSACLHPEDFGTNMDLISKSEKLRSKSSDIRAKSASRKGPPSQFMSRSVTSTKPSCMNLLKVKDAVERAIRVSTTILYGRNYSCVRNFHLPSNFNICYGAFGHRW